ncbi:alpha-amylase, putative [Talaromyces islandicus]|uniref:alpha-amylase n=1 Tax=Talaromyces islandicus TaxID=28573 RepID=A0A0U1M310_TALIS|nr:alpha-amylase, putative [Talaromyces islandicus]
MYRFIRIITAAAALAGSSYAASADEWAARSIYQVITDRYAQISDSPSSCNITKYCGGTWRGLAGKLDYIQDMGFTALQISPIQQNIPQDTVYGEAYHGYWPQNLYALNEHFGTADDLKYLVSELHKRNMYLMIDVVANELAYDIGNTNMTESTHIDYSSFVPFNQSSDFNPYCPIINWSNRTEFTNCWLGYQGVATPRIKTSDKKIAATLGKWISDLVKTYDIDGIRIDGAKQIESDFFPAFAQSAGVFAMAEVFDGTPDFVCGYQNMINGLENYPVYGKTIDAFTAGKMDDLVTMVETVQKTCKSPQYLVNFLENQDNPRFATYTNDIALAKNALAFTILADGIPKMYYGQEQHLPGNYSPYNRQALWDASPTYDQSTELYSLATKVNKLRNHAISVDDHYLTNWSTILYHDGSTYATRKGPNGAQVIAVLSNQGTQGGDYTLEINGVADPGTNLTEVTLCNSTVVAGPNGTITVPMGQGQPRVYFPTFNLNNSGLCGQSSPSVSVSNSAQPSATASFVTQHGLGTSLEAPAWLHVVCLAIMMIALV